MRFPAKYYVADGISGFKRDDMTSPVKIDMCVFFLMKRLKFGEKQRELASNMEPALHTKVVEWRCWERNHHPNEYKMRTSTRT